MATANPFNLLGDDDNDDPSQLLQKIVAAPAKKSQAAETAVQPSAKLPSKPLHPAQAVREAKDEVGRGGRCCGRGRGGGGFNRDSANNEGSFANRRFSGGQGVLDESDSGKDFYRRGGYGALVAVDGFSNEDAEDGGRPRRPFECHSRTGQGNEFKHEEDRGSSDRRGENCGVYVNLSQSITKKDRSQKRM